MTTAAAAQPLVFSADALIRTRAGRLLVHTTASALPAFETDNPMLIGWLCQFARPFDPAAALQALPAADRDQLVQIIGYLRRSGVLVAADPAAAPAAATTPAPVLVRQHLRALSRGLYELGCDVLAEGDALEAEIERSTGVGLERRLLGMLAALDGLRAEVHRTRDARLRRQLATVQQGQGAAPYRLHIGCGPGLLEGWVNIDVAPAPLALNILRGLPFPDASSEYVFVSHALEHLFYPRDVLPFLAELRRVLRPGGIARIVVPDVALSIEAYANQDASFFASRRETWSWWPENPTRLEDFLAYAGAGCEPAFAFESHKYGYDFETLQKLLQQAGFTDVLRCGYMQSRHPALRVDSISSVAQARFGERYYSLFVEATRPVA